MFDNIMFMQEVIHDCLFTSVSLYAGNNHTRRVRVTRRLRSSQRVEKGRAAPGIYFPSTLQDC